MRLISAQPRVNIWSKSVPLGLISGLLLEPWGQRGFYSGRQVAVMENISLELSGQEWGLAYMYTNEVGRVQKDGEAGLKTLFGSLDPTMPEVDPWVLFSMCSQKWYIPFLLKLSWAFCHFQWKDPPHTFGGSKKQRVLGDCWLIKWCHFHLLYCFHREPQHTGHERLPGFLFITLSVYHHLHCSFHPLKSVWDGTTPNQTTHSVLNFVAETQAWTGKNKEQWWKTA